MLAKIWKKVLLAVCIVACLFNIMSKLVSRTSLEINLKSVENGEGIFSIFENKEEEQEEESDIIEGVINQETTSTENDVKNNTKDSTREVVDIQTEEVDSSDFVVIY